MKALEKPYSLAVFPSKLGWFAILEADERVAALTFGHNTAKSAREALPGFMADQAVMAQHCNNNALEQRIEAYAQGAAGDDFLDVQLDLGGVSDFERRILVLCRKIPMGTTVSYGQLAVMAGSPRAARAVGNIMAGNRIPILIPCHRVVLASGGLGSYSAPGGVGMKERLLTMEKRWKERAFCAKKLA